MVPLKTLALGSEILVTMTAESGLDWRQQCLQAEGPVRTQLQKGPDTAARREPRIEKKQRCPTVSGWGGPEAGSALNCASDRRRSSSWQGEMMSCPDALNVTHLENIQLPGSENRGPAAQRRGQGS